MDDVVLACRALVDGKSLAEAAVEVERSEASVRMKLNALRRQGAAIPPLPRKSRTAQFTIDDLNKSLPKFEEKKTAKPKK